MNQFFGLKNYVDLFVSDKEDYSDPKVLIDDCIQFIQDSEEKRPQAYVLEGKSGGGKSQFLLYLIRELNKLFRENKIDEIKIIFVRLREYSEGNLQQTQSNSSLK